MMSIERVLQAALLPLGRRACPGLDPRWPEGPDEGAFIPRAKQVAPHQFGQMTYGCVTKRARAAWERRAAVSHGLTSSPPRGEEKSGTTV